MGDIELACHTLSWGAANHVTAIAEVARCGYRGIEATPVDIPADQNEATLRIRFADVAGPFNAPVVVRATARLTRTVTVRGRPLREGDPVIAVTRISVVPERFRRFCCAAKWCKGAQIGGPRFNIFPEIWRRSLPDRSETARFERAKKSRRPCRLYLASSLRRF